MKVGWIGLGEMGLRTAKHVAASGYAVCGYDLSPPPPDRTGDIRIVESVAAAAEGCDLLGIAVFSDQQVEEVLTGEHGVLGGLRPGAVVAVFTTGSIEAIQAFAARAPAGVAVLDTCFSRKQRELKTDKMTLLVGGPAEAIERAKPVLQTFAPRIFHVGGSGAGRAIKLVNNILFAAHAQLAADALKLAHALGLERSSTAAALMECSAASDVMGNFVDADPGPILEGYERYLIKDVAAALEAAHKADVPVATLRAATAEYQAP